MTADDAIDAVDLEAACAAVFDLHRVDAFGGTFHVPDVNRYPALFAWDSGYHALATVHLRPDLALAELATLYRANTLPDGLLSHQRYVPGAEDHQAMIEGLFGPMFEGDRSPFIDPPTAAYAAARLALLMGPDADGVLDRAVGHLDALGERRTIDGCTLPVALHPFETGTEGSAVMAGLMPGDLASSLAQLKAWTVSAVGAAMAPTAALSAGHGFVVLDPTVCGWYLLALEEAAHACRARGRRDDASRLADRAVRVASDIVDRLWWDEQEIFAGYDLTADRRLRGIGAMGLISAASAVLAEEGFSARVGARHLRPGEGMWGRRGYAAGEVTAGAGVGDVVQWRGNAVWGATVYWAHLLALRVGRLDLAAQLRAELEALIRAHGFREFYDAWSGDPGGAGAESGFTWPALVLDMRGREKSAGAA